MCLRSAVLLRTADEARACIHVARSNAPENPGREHDAEAFRINAHVSGDQPNVIERALEVSELLVGQSFDRRRVHRSVRRARVLTK